MAKFLFFMVLLSAVAGMVVLAAAPPSTNITVYELLPKFCLPPGLLPDIVTSFSLSNDGSFVVELESTCYVQFDYLVYYEKQITGKVQLGGISDLQGIQVKRFFLWFDVDAIKVDLPPSDYIYFYVGLITKKLGIEQFETVHSCDSSLSCAATKLLRSAKTALVPPEPLREIGMLLTE